MASQRYRPIGVGLHDDHNAGIAAVRDGRVILYCEFERLTRVKNQGGKCPDLVVDMLHRLPLSEVDVISAPDPDFLASLLQEQFGATLTTTSIAMTSVNYQGHPVRIYRQETPQVNMHGPLHVMAMLPMTGIDPGIYMVMVFDAEQPRFGWVDIRENPTAPTDVALGMVSSERWFNGEIFADLYGKIFYGSYDLKHCGKLMGLASWGRPRFRYARWLAELARRHFDPSPPTWLGYSEAPPLALRSEVQAFLGIDSVRHDDPKVIDLAAAAQELFTHELVAQAEIALRRVRAELAELGLPPPIGLLYGGGCALSVVSNSMLREALDIPMVVLPYAHDASQFLGGAVWANLMSADGPWPVGLGWSDIPHHTVGVVDQAAVASLGLPLIPAVPEDVARRIATGQLVALVRGGAEAGPRALGRRSLLANALDASMRDRLNHQVKRREWYRPFAPALPAPEFHRYFATSASLASEYMLDSYRLLPAFRSVLSAVSSPDGTTRPQAVHRSRDPWYADLLHALGAVTGHPVVLNTSLNGPGLPIAFDLNQVLADCVSLNLDAAIIDGVILDRQLIQAGARAAINA